MSQTKLSAIAVISMLSAVALSACDGADALGTPDSDLASDLRRGADFDVAGTSAEQVSAEAAALRIDRVAPVDFAIEGGTIGVRADGDGGLSLDALELELGDIVVPADILPPNGIELTDVTVELAATARGEAEWTTDGARADVALSVSLALKWAVLRDGRPVPLADVNVDAVPVFVSVETRGSEQVLTLSADRSGPFWNWANTFELRDLQMELDAVR